MSDEPSSGGALSREDEETIAPPPGAIGQASLGQFLEGLPRCEPGRYQTGEEIGRGGMGTVHEVHDSSLDRSLAMKAIRNRFDAAQGSIAPSPRELWRFLAEARITARLDHPGIVPVHELGVSPSGQVYFTMKRVEGDDMLRILRRMHKGHPDWSLARVLELLVRVGDTLAFAHDRGIVHRDLKPANIMVGAFGEVYVMDWGLAKVVSGNLLSADVTQFAEEAQAHPSPEGSTDTEGSTHTESWAGLTLDGTVVGSPPYMPPEQATGDLERIGPHTDVYALGALLYHALCGAPPYVETSSSEQGSEDILAAVKTRAPEAIPEVAPDAPPELVAICEKAMSRDPAHRYATAAYFAQDLRNFCNDRVVEAYGAGPLIELRKWIRRNRALASSIAVAVLVVISVVAAFGVRERMAAEDLRGALDRERQALASESVALSEADQARERAEGLRLAAISESIQDKDATLALLLSLEAMERAPGSASRQAILGALSRSREHRVLTGHDAYVTWVAWMDGGRLLVSKDMQDIVVVWDAESGEPITRIFTPGDRLVATDAQFGSALIVTVSEGGSLRLWDGRTGAIVREEHTEPGGATVAALSPRLDLVCVSHASGALELRDVPDLRVRTRLPGAGSPVAWMRLSATGDRVVAVDTKGLVRVMDTASGELQGEFQLPLVSQPNKRFETITTDRECRYLATGVSTTEGLVFALDDGGVVFRDPDAAGVQVSPDASVLAVQTLLDEDTSHARTELTYLDFPSMQQRTLAIVEGGIGAHAISGDAELQAIVLDSRRSMALVSTSTGRIEGRLLGHRYHVRHVAFSPRGQQLASAANDQSVRIWWARSPYRQPLVPLRGRPASGRVVALSHDARAFARVLDRVGPGAGKESEQLDVIDRAGGYVKFSVDLGQRSRAVFSHDGSRLAAWHVLGPGRPHWRIWDVQGRSAPIDLPEGFPAAGKFSRDGTRFLCRGADSGSRKLRVHSTADGSVLQEITAQTQFVGCAISPHGDLVATADRYQLRGSVYSTETGELVTRGGDHHGMVLQVQFSPDGTRVASSAVDSTVQVWDARTGDPVEKIGGLPMRPIRLHWTDDGELLALAAGSTLILAEAETGLIQASLDLARRRIIQVESAPDGSCLWVLDTDGLLERVPRRLVEEGQKLVARQLSPLELAEYGLADGDALLAARRRDSIETISLGQLLAWGRTCRKEGRREEARASFQKAVDLWGGLPQATLARLFIQLMDLENRPGDRSSLAGITESIAAIRRIFTPDELRKHPRFSELLEDGAFAPFVDDLMKED